MISSLSRLRISEAAGSGPIENGWEIIDDDDFTDNEWPGPVPTQTKPKRETEKSKIEEPRVEDPRVEEPKMAEPEAEEPGVEKRRIEKLRVEEPRVEERKIQEPKAEQPKVSKAIEKAKPTLADTTSPKAEKTEDIKVVNKPASRLREDSETKEQTTKKALTQEEVEAKKLVYSQKRRSALYALRTAIDNRNEPLVKSLTQTIKKYDQRILELDWMRAPVQGGRLESTGNATANILTLDGVTAARLIQTGRSKCQLTEEDLVRRKQERELYMRRMSTIEGKRELV